MRRFWILSALCGFAALPLFAGCSSDGTKSAAPLYSGSHAGAMSHFDEGKPTRVPIPPTDTTFPAGSACAFALSITTVGKEKGILFPPQPNGDQVEQITGSLKGTLTNLSNNKSMTANLSGPGTEIFHADGSLTFDAEGVSFFAFAPTDIPAGPDAFISKGPVDDFFTSSGQQILQSENGTQIDVCNALT